MDTCWIILIAVCVASSSASSTSPQQQAIPTTINTQNQTSNETMTLPSQDNVLDPDTFFGWFQNGMKPETSTQEANTLEAQSSEKVIEDFLTTPESIVPSVDNTPIRPDEFYSWFENINARSNSNHQQEILSTELPFEEGTVTDSNNELNQEHETSTALPEEVPTASRAELDILNEMFPHSFRTMAPLQDRESKKSEQDSTASVSITTHRPSDKFGKGVKPKIPSPDEFFGSFSRNHQRDHVSMEKTSTLTNEERETSILIISACVSAGILGVIAIVVTAFVLHRRKTRKSKIPEDNQMKSENSIYSNGCTDVFHGIPTNNDIWKNLDMLSMNAPSVFPNSPPKHS